MRILLSNDDGYRATGLAHLCEAMTELGDVHVVAPDRDRSGASNSLTLDTPIRAHTAENGFVYVNGTPTDCVHLAITGLLEREPDIVVSGINAGGNLGDDVLYSGTVAAAMEGRFLGLPAVAVSLVLGRGGHYETAARVARLLVPRISLAGVPANTILNVNVPDVPWSHLRGMQVTRLGHRHRSEPVVRGTDPRGRELFWVGPPGAEQDAGEGTDFQAVRTGHVSITPLQVDLTRHTSMGDVREWVGELEVP
jgi:5'-nucleotidase